jgi:hypothetical protein
MHISVTSGTIMHGTKLPLQLWFLAIYVVATGEICSARRLAETLQLNYRTALRMLLLIRHVMGRENGSHLLADMMATVHADVCDKNGRDSMMHDIGNDSLKADASAAEQGNNVINRAKKIMMCKATAFIRRTYRSVSRHRLQRYIDEYYFRWTHRFEACVFTELLEACGQSYYMPKFVIRD